MTDSPLDRFAALQGLGRSYYDHRGELRYFTAEAKAAILGAMGYVAHDAASLDAALSTRARQEWERLIPPVSVLTQNEPAHCELRLRAAALTGSIEWRIRCEDDSERKGVAALPSLESMERVELSEPFTKLRLPLPSALPLGYHTLAVTLPSGAVERGLLIVAPAHCFEPASIGQGARPWGVAIQLYSLRSSLNWGMGDFADLRELIALAAPQGCGLIGLNPLHALRPADPAHISPYSPSSRQFLNVLYIAVTEVPEYAECEAASRYVTQPATRERIQSLRAVGNVDYVGVAEIKFKALHLSYAHFRARHLAQGTARAVAFRRYVDLQGEPLLLQALYDALDKHFCAQPGSHWGWQSWPTEYHDPQGAAARRFLHERPDEVEFFQYLQWLAEEQLAAAQTLARTLGMSIGVYGDVAVGVNPSGAESWSNQRLYLNAVSIGAPPDPLALKGQDWGIPPQDPNELRAQAYLPIIDMLRNNMRHAGALRIDHVMALCRLWWVPRGFTATDGVYVRYPLAELMAIVALESVRNRCLIIGEDLGTVPDEMRAAMEQYGLYHYKVLFFEKERDERFKLPEQYLPHALATVTTHDLPPLKAWWDMHDIVLRDRLRMYPDDSVLQQVRLERDRDRHALMTALVQRGLWHWQPHEPLPPYSHALMRAVHLFLGLSKSSLVMVQLEDLLGMIDPVNVPGTSTEHPNWQRKLAGTAAELFKKPEVLETLQALNRARRGENPNS